MAKSSVLLVLMLVAYTAFVNGSSFGGTDGDGDNDLPECLDNPDYPCEVAPCDAEDEILREDVRKNCPVKCNLCEECYDNPDYPCENAPCNDVKLELQEDVLRNCPRKCKVCSSYQCKDDPRQKTFCNLFKRACEPQTKEADSFLRYLSHSTLYREKLWKYCRKTCDYECAPKMAAEPKCPTDKICCWDGKMLDVNSGEECAACEDKFSRLCGRFKDQCECTKRRKSSTCGPGSFVYSNCPETCGLCGKTDKEDSVAFLRSLEK